METYDSLCTEAETDYEGFWARLARSNLLWSTPFTEVLDESIVGWRVSSLLRTGFVLDALEQVLWARQPERAAV